MWPVRIFGHLILFLFIRSNSGSSVAGIFASSALRIQMVSSIDTARRALVTLLKSLAGIYCVVVISQPQEGVQGGCLEERSNVQTVK